MTQLRGRRPEGVDLHPADDPGDPIEVARSICLSQLAVRPRSRAELLDVLRRRGVPPDAAIEVVDRFEEVGLVNDADYAALVVDSTVRSRGLSRRAVTNELRSRGIADETAEHALERLDPETEYATARRIACRRINALQRVEPVVARRRVFAALARRGFSADVIRGVIDELLGGSAADEPTAYEG